MARAIRAATPAIIPPIAILSALAAGITLLVAAGEPVPVVAEAKPEEALPLAEEATDDAADDVGATAEDAAEGNSDDAAVDPVDTAELAGAELDPDTDWAASTQI